MVTELVTFKMEKNFLTDLDKTVKKTHFQNRTEFIRNALREKVDEIKLRETMMKLSKLRGKAPRKTTDEEIHRIREQVFEEFDKKLK